MRYKNDFEKAKAVAFRYLSCRARSIKEVRDRLEKSGFEDVTIRRTIDRLIELGYLNDARFAMEWTEYMIKNKNCGPRRITQSLKDKGVEREIIEEAMKDFDNFKEMAVARDAFQARIRKEQSGRKWDRKKKASLYRYLVRKGFSSHIALDLINEFQGDGNDV